MLSLGGLTSPQSGDQADQRSQADIHADGIEPEY
jgi:hypothetical protein